MLKLYRMTDGAKEYWETWENEDGTHMVHWGKLGTQGSSKTVKDSLFKKAKKTIQVEIDNMVAKGFRPVDLEQHSILLIEYAIDGMGSTDDLDKRQRLDVGIAVPGQVVGQ